MTLWTTTPPEITTYPNAVRYLYDRVDLERLRVVRYDTDTFKLDRMVALMEKLGNPQQQVRMVHVAGTVGKGSTVAWLAAVANGRPWLCAGHARDVWLRPAHELRAVLAEVEGVTVCSEYLAERVRAARPRLLRKQGRQSSFFEGFLGRVEGGPRDTERLGH